MKTILMLLVGICVLSGCRDEAAPVWSGWLEGETIAVGANAAGVITGVNVRRGQTVSAGQALYSVEAVTEQAAYQEALAQLHRAEAQWTNLSKGARPSELASLQAQLSQARTTAQGSYREWQRRQALVRQNFVSQQQADDARTAYDRDTARVREIEAQLRTARSSARVDELKAAEAGIAAAKAQLARAEWLLNQKRVKSPVSGIVDDVLYRPGEWINHGQAVVLLLPPQNLKARFYLPQTELGRLPLGQRLQMSCDGCGAPIEARLDFVSKQAEYTPPVIYSRENRADLVYRAEARLDPKIAARLHAGQPIDIRLPAAQP